MSRDSERRMQEGIEEVLNTFGITGEYIRRSNHPAVTFNANGKNILFTYSATGDPRAHLNARSDLRRLCLSAGAKPIEEPVPVIKVRDTLMNGVSNKAMCSSTTPVMTQINEPKITEPQIMEDVIVRDTPEVFSEEPEEVSMPSPQRKLNDDDFYTVFKARQLSPGKVIVIELDRDLVVQKGTLLVIPLHRPNTVHDISRELFDVMFTEMEAEPEPAAHTEPELQPQPDIVEEAVVQFDPMSDEALEVDLPLQPGTLPPWLRDPEPAVDAKPVRKKKRAVNYIPTPYRDMHPRSVKGISPQSGRVLASMVHVTDLTGKNDLSPELMDGTLLPHDRYQYSARVRDLKKLGLVDSGLPVPGAGNKGYLSKVTAKGHKMIKEITPWCWLFDGLPVPTWVQR